MTLLGLDIHHIVELGTQIATAGAFRLLDGGDDEIFEYVVGIAVLVYEMDPG
jgi:hypothetical protein